MNVVDSSLWIERLNNTDAGQIVADVVRNCDLLVVPTISIYEVYKKVLCDISIDQALYSSMQMRRGRVIDLDYELSESAARISVEHKLPAADSIIYATTKKHKCILWTQDEHFAGLPSVNYFEKKK